MSAQRDLPRRFVLATTALAALAALPLLLAQAPAAGKKYAVLIGVKEYDHTKLKPLGYPENDVEELAALLRPAGYEVVLLTNTAGRRDPELAPTLANINAQLAKVVKKCKRQDLLLVCLTGHGLQFEKSKETDPDDAYFCPRDARPFADERETLLSLKALYEQLDRSGAGVKLLLVDACREEVEGRKKGINGTTSPRPPSGTVALFSCSAGEHAWESDKLKHGVFFPYVLEGLRGRAKNEDNEVTWDGLQQYVRKRVSRDVAELVGPAARQTPALNAGELAGEPPVLLSLTKEPARLDCTTEDGVSAAEVRRAQEAWAKYLGRRVEETIEIADSVKMTFVLVPPGKFLMGSPEGEKDRQGDETQHEVTLTEPFYLGKTEVTQAQYQALELENPSDFKGDDLPVEHVCWEEARDWAATLTKKREDKHLYRLPTEAEWEYSCRGGRSSKPFGVGDGRALSSREANFDGNYPYGGAEKGPNLKSTCAVASYPANALGLHDMHGNVCEWCQDWYGPYPRGAVTNPTGPEREGAVRGPQAGPYRVSRGGSWGYGARNCRAAYRDRFAPADRYGLLGFRVARSIPSGK